MGRTSKKDSNIEKNRFSCHYSSSDDDEILKFANMQSNFNDTIRYLIQNHINERGIEDLANVLPSIRSKDYKLPPLKVMPKASVNTPKPIKHDTEEPGEPRRVVEEKVKHELVSEKTSSLKGPEANKELTGSRSRVSFPAGYSDE